MNQIIEKLLQEPEESHTLEFKTLSHIKNEVSRVVETIVSIANTEGGLVVIGISDPSSEERGVERIIGIDQDLDNFDAIGRELQRVTPPISNLWPPLIIQEGEKRIAIIQVPKLTDQLRSLDKHVWVRQQKSNRILSPHEIIKYSYLRGFERADKLPVEVNFKLLETSTYQEWKTARGISGSTIQSVLEKTGLAIPDKDDILKPTLASVLLFAEYPNDLTEFKCSIRVLQYTGNIETIGETPNLLGNPKSINGPIIKQISDAHEYVLNILRSGITIPSGFQTKYKLPERAVKEAITNAVIHRDYFLRRDIEIRIFEDRIEVESPGLLPFNITVSNIGKTRADGYRNDLIVKHLREFPSPPNLDQNEGVRAMRKEMAKNDLYWPLYITYPYLQESVRVVLFNEKAPSEWDKVLHFFKSNKYITNEDARKVTNIPQRDKMSKMLRKWVNKRLLVAIRPESGYVKGVKYRLSEESEVNLHANDSSK